MEPSQQGKYFVRRKRNQQLYINFKGQRKDIEVSLNWALTLLFFYFD